MENTHSNSFIIIIKVEMKRCYYELLGVDKKATTAEIKQSYRKNALKYHPDKNSSEEGKEMFLLVTEAYNVLSDPNERTFYDNNREKLLFNKEEMSKEDLEIHTFGFNIWNYFTVSCFKGFEDDNGGFFQVYREVFERLKQEEAKAFAMRDEDEGEAVRKYEGFGDSTTNMDRLVRFYQDWENFTTYKTFVWADDWDTREAQNRYMKRAMEKENKKERQKEKKTYIKTIKDLVSFLKKRDPRYRELLTKQKEREEERESQNRLREEQKKREKEEMKKVKAELELKRYEEIEEYFQKQNAGNAKGSHDDEDQFDDTAYEFFCQVCEKEFKSENQLKNHEKSKMHKQKVKNLQKEVMLKEEVVLEVQKSISKDQQATEKKEEPQKGKKKQKKRKNNTANDDDIVVTVQEEKTTEPAQEKQDQPKKGQIAKQEEAPKKERKVSEQSSNDDTDAFMEAMMGGKKVEVPKQVAGQNNKNKNKNKVILKDSQSESSESEEERNQNKGKAKLKREKKAAKKDKQTNFKCNVCQEYFQSKSKLFDHIKKSGHAKAV